MMTRWRREESRGDEGEGETDKILTPLATGASLGSEPEAAEPACHTTHTYTAPLVDAQT